MKLVQSKISTVSIRLFVLSTLCSAISVAHATNGYFAQGYGVAGEATAGVATALPQDSLVIATNPAAISALNSRIDLGADWFTPKRKASITNNAFAADGTYDGNGKKNFIIPSLGYTKAIDSNLSIGLAIYGNGGMNTLYKNNPYQRFGATGEAGVNLEQLFITPAVSWKINPTNSLGLAANLAYQRFEAKGLAVFSPFSTDAAHLTNQGVDTATGVGVRLGWFGQPTSWLNLGAAWASKINSSSFDKYRGLFAEHGDFDIPENFSIGAAIKPIDHLHVGLDWQKIKYSDVSSVGNSITHLFQGYPLGSDNGGGFGWKDVSVVKVGVVYDVLPSITLRAGYSKADQPIPNQETFFNILAPAVIEKHWSVGGTWHLNAKNDISFAYTRALNHTVNGSQSIPVGYPPAGLGGGNANISLSEEILSLGWGIKI